MTSRMHRWMGVVTTAALLGAGCGDSKPEPEPEPDTYDWQLPMGFPKPRVPADNPMTEAKVELGRHLFYDTRLSLNGTQSCGSCHFQNLAFTDGRKNALGSTGEVHRRNAQGLINVAYATSLTWANPSLTTLELQALTPLFGKEPVELGFGDRQEELLERLRSDVELVSRFAEAFPGEAEPVSLASLTRALASFQRTLISGNSPYDRYVYRGEAGALSPAAVRGMDLFMSERLECNHCHSGFNFLDASATSLTATPVQAFHNTGLYNEDGQGAYPAEDPGVIELTGQREDMGRFRASSLRNIAVTAPYMHDGSIATLSEVIDHYAAGGKARLRQGGPLSPMQSGFVRGFTLTEQEKADLLAFLEALTDTEFLSNPRFSDPFASP
ncbi:methanobactin export MATE transporter MbnM [Hyalangium rubrum]|uniref:Di-heme enzyme n=1 Tax=Hyalangium rubrum TaxID=3103134 RepID=A0ABU5HBT4_9BACT|nr:methanobactin export MATE transporter MbnM [Hyalangium sp. s54d21]MDY7230339.1 di-heme enzyme [Hyalangium sp. s54d21]